MLTTCLEPSSGQILFENNSCIKKKLNEHYQKMDNALLNKKNFWKTIGYCPQFDALYDELTPSEHIKLFARIKGIKSMHEITLCNRLFERLDLLNYANKPCGKLSLGNKRKVSTALSLVGNPSIILLDEPTSGMDPMSRRRLWQEIINLTNEKNHSVLLTSHSMEECERLCTRLAIMVDGSFKCLGSGQHLKSKFGDGYTLTVKLKESKKNSSRNTNQQNDDNTSEIYFQQLKIDYNHYADLILNELRKNVSPDCKLKEQHFNNVFQFELNHDTKLGKNVFTKQINIGDIYKLIELNKLKFSIVDYSLSENTLDNVFINFVRKQTDEKDQSNEANECGNKRTKYNLKYNFPIHDNDDQLIDLTPDSDLIQLND
jgi:ATP-binding cassette subfamily A (ABC1) protein 2